MDPPGRDPHAGTPYWFSVANAMGSGWTWALAGGVFPTIGSQSDPGVVSTGIGPNGGPHFGPWDPLTGGPNFAFQVEVIPEPSTFVLVGLGLVVLGTRYRRRTMP